MYLGPRNSLNQICVPIFIIRPKNICQTTPKKDLKLAKFEEKNHQKTAKIEQITQTFIAICHFSLRSRNLRPIAFEPQDSKDHFRYLTFWVRITRFFFFFPTSEKCDVCGSVNPYHAWLDCPVWSQALNTIPTKKIHRTGRIKVWQILRNRAVYNSHKEQSSFEGSKGRRTRSVTVAQGVLFGAPQIAASSGIPLIAFDFQAN